MLRNLADSNRPQSFGNRFRNRRHALFVRLTDALTHPIRIIDLGGTSTFWEQRGWANRENVHITTVNLDSEPKRFDNIEPRVGDATNLAEFGDNQFDVAFSNSVIEHLFTFEKQEAMAAEMQRVGRACWMQTPNYWFPIEPHFHLPGWQWMPRRLRVALLRRRRCGWRGPIQDPRAAALAVDEIRLLTRRELRQLFPEATLIAERFMGLVKSWIAVSGFPEVERAAL